VSESAAQDRHRRQAQAGGYQPTRNFRGKATRRKIIRLRHKDPSKCKRPVHEQTGKNSLMIILRKPARNSNQIDLPKLLKTTH
jgi:hypothetical protein